MDSRKITDPLNRGMVGGLLGMPADMLNMLRNGGRSVGNLANRLAGVNAPPAPMVENPAYGQEWWGNKMQEAGYVSPNRNKLAEFGAGLLDPGSVMTDVPMLAKGLFGLGDPATTKMLGGLLGATVWHGSPHKFDKFDSSKIGTGEGAQAYGHGLYLAESPTVAKSYQEALSSTAPAKRMVSQSAGDVDAALQAAQSSVDGYKTLIANGGGGDMRRAQSMLSIAQKRLEDVQRMKAGLPEETGSLYKVDLPDEDIARMLDYDKPLSEQPAQLKALRSIADKIPGLSDALQPFELGSTTGATVNNFISRAQNPQAAADALRSAGIPGIRYLDGGSRDAGQGSSNFVVFPGNENRLKILERNGQPLK